MDKIKFGLFDLFRYTIPGLFILFSLTLLASEQIIDLSTLFAAIKQNVNLAIGLGLGIGGYIIGLANDFVGNYINKKIGRKLWKLEQRKNKMPEDEKHSLVRHHSPENFKYVEVWNVMKGTSANLASATLLFLLVCILKLVANLPNFGTWLVLTVASLFVFMIFLKKANEFDQWSRNEIDNTVNFFVLEKGPKIKKKEV